MTSNQLATRPSDSSGAVFLIVAVATVALLSLCFVVIFVSYIGMARSDLRTATDAAALAGAGSLCSSDDCWDQARNAALLAFENHKYHAGIGSSLALDPNNTFDRDQFAYEWDLTAGGTPKNLLVTVERGRWVKGQFLSMEDDEQPGDWQATYPGIPRALAANAIRVSAKYPQVHGTWEKWFGSTALSMSASAIAVAGSTESIPVAPLAIPACALIDDDGKYQADNVVCQADRLFAAASAAANVSRPAFAYNPCMKYVAETPTAPTSQHCGAPWTPNRTHIGTGNIGWYNLGLDSVADQYGVVGLPGNWTSLVQSGDPNAFENKIVDDMQNNRDFWAELDDEFTPLPNGFKLDSTGDWIWANKINSLTDAVEAADTDLNSFSTANTTNPFNPSQIWVSSNFDIQPTTASSTYNSVGLCRSRITGFECQVPSPKPATCSDASVVPGSYLPVTNRLDDDPTAPAGRRASECCDQQATKSCTTVRHTVGLEYRLRLTTSEGSATNPYLAQVWRTPVAVIADTSSKKDPLASDYSATVTPCKGILGSTSPDPIIDAAYTHVRIIGFVWINMFDLDIGQVTGLNASAVLPKKVDTAATSGAVTCKNNTGDYNPVHWLYDQDGDSKADSCGVMRARMDCKAGIIGTAKTDVEQGVRLVQ